MRSRVGGWLLAAWLVLPGCGMEPDRVFERNAPQVDRAIEALDAGEAGPAAELLQAYLGTGKCEKGEIGVTDLARARSNASFDLGLALFLLGEKFGARFGEEESSIGDGGPTDEQKQQMELRSEQVTCALKLLRAIGSSADLPVDLAARASAARSTACSLQSPLFRRRVSRAFGMDRTGRFSMFRWTQSVSFRARVAWSSCAEQIERAFSWISG